MIIKISVGIRSDEAPTFMEDEKPGVFATEIIEVPDDDAQGPMFAKWLLDKEDELLKKTVIVRFEQAVDDDA